MGKRVILLATILVLILVGAGISAISEEAVSRAAPPLQRPTPTSKPEATKPPTEEPEEEDKEETKPTKKPPVYPVLAPLTAPILRLPEQGPVYQNPVTFQWEWEGVLGEGQAFQVSAWHPESDAALQSPSLSEASWTTSLPTEKAGEWRWNVSVVQGDSVLITSAEGTFLFESFSPSPSPSPTPTPTSSETTTPVSMPSTGLGRAVGLPACIAGTVLVGALITIRYLRKRSKKQQQ
jgi:hypothetical protein